MTKTMIVLTDDKLINRSKRKRRAGGEEKTGRCHRSGNLGVVVGEVGAGGVGLASLSTIPRGRHIVLRLKKVVSLRQARPI